MISTFMAASLHDICHMFTPDNQRYSYPTRILTRSTKGAALRRQQAVSYTHLDALVSLPSSFDTKEGIFELGSWWHPAAAKQDGHSPEEIAMARINSISPDDRLQLRLHGKGFFFDNARRKHGALMHEVLSQIRTCLLYTSRCV